ncbi:MAG: hypothetical protein F9K40_01125 [Kofleriaceae bacterium]|nr:MAG: hypothetical protein F9K40_01125 [Kofleriaceae bacterium]MBZ0232209.1 hypothetical protein [Kofleriaceae bacterium]
MKHKIALSLVTATLIFGSVVYAKPKAPDTRTEKQKCLDSCEAKALICILALDPIQCVRDIVEPCKRKCEEKHPDKVQ